jgi:hypothetical protein
MEGVEGDNPTRVYEAGDTKIETVGHVLKPSGASIFQLESYIDYCKIVKGHSVLFYTSTGVVFTSPCHTPLHPYQQFSPGHSASVIRDGLCGTVRVMTTGNWTTSGNGLSKQGCGEATTATCHPVAYSLICKLERGLERDAQAITR